MLMCKFCKDNMCYALYCYYPLYFGKNETCEAVDENGCVRYGDYAIVESDGE